MEDKTTQSRCDTGDTESKEHLEHHGYLRREVPIDTPDIRAAVAFAIREQHSDEYVANYDPEQRFHTAMFSFSRALMSCYPTLDPDEILDLIAPVVEELGGWGKILLLGDDVPEDYEAEFVVTCTKVRSLINEHPLEAAHRRATAQPLTPERCLRHPGRYKEYARFISLLGWLQEGQGSGAILIPRREVAEVLGLNRMTVSRYCELAIRDGLLSKLSDHSWENHRATEYRFNTERLSELRHATRRRRAAEWADESLT